MAFSYINSGNRNRKAALTDMINRRQQGQSFYTIARAHKISQSTAHRLITDELHARGIKLPAFHRPKTCTHPFFDPEE